MGMAAHLAGGEKDAQLAAHSGRLYQGEDRLLASLPI